MNLIGKIFVVLIFVMSLVFMSFAVAVYGTHQNWKVEAAKRRRPWSTRPAASCKRPRTKKTQLEADIAKEAVAKRQALAKLETERDELQKAASRRLPSSATI